MFVCRFDNCEKSYKKPSLLELHENTHLNKRPFACGVCEKKYFKKSHLNAHYLRIHSQKGRQECTDCGKVLASEESLKRHGDVCGRIFKCTLCQMEFVRAKWYLDHTRGCVGYRINRTATEDGETEKEQNRKLKEKIKQKKEKDLHRCTLCGKGYKLKRNCAYHERTAHSEEEHSCKICNKKYKHKGSLSRHRISTHRSSLEEESTK